MSKVTVATDHLRSNPPWRNWLARLTVIRTRLMAHQEVESSSLSGGVSFFPHQASHDRYLYQENHTGQDWNIVLRSYTRTIDRNEKTYANHLKW